MKALMILMMLGGYNQNTPAVTSVYIPEMSDCLKIAADIKDDFSRKFGSGWVNEGRQDGPYDIRAKCYEVQP